MATNFEISDDQRKALLDEAQKVQDLIGSVLAKAPKELEKELKEARKSGEQLHSTVSALQATSPGTTNGNGKPDANFKKPVVDAVQGTLPASLVYLMDPALQKGFGHAYPAAPALLGALASLSDKAHREVPVNKEHKGEVALAQGLVGALPVLARLLIKRT